MEPLIGGVGALIGCMGYAIWKYTRGVETEAEEARVEREKGERQHKMELERVAFMHSEWLADYNQRRHEAENELEIAREKLTEQKKSMTLSRNVN